MAVLAPLIWRPSPNFSARPLITDIRMLVWHSTAGPYEGACTWLCSPKAAASAHLVIREDGGEVTQLVALHNKAWHAEAVNAYSVGVEHASLGRGFATVQQRDESARVFAYLCHLFGIPPVDATHRRAGIVRHRSLGAAGGGHSDGPDAAGWLYFLERVADELDRGGFRKTWARL